MDLLVEDYVIKAVAANGTIRAFAGSFRNTVNEAQNIHKTSPVATAALGRTLAMTSIMGLMLKDDNDLITVSIKCDGPAAGILATASSNGYVKGYIFNHDINLPLKKNGKLDVCGAVGSGTLTVIKDLGLKEPYSGQIRLVSGEIAEDFAHYFAHSEQTPSAVSLGVLVDVDYSVKHAGGFVIQSMPGADDNMLDHIQEKFLAQKSITTLLEEGSSPETMLESVLGEFGLSVLEKCPVKYYCNCSWERVRKALISLGSDEINEILAEDKQAEINCHFCGKKYFFGEADLEDILCNMKPCEQEL